MDNNKVNALIELRNQLREWVIDVKKFEEAWDKIIFNFNQQ